MALSLRELLSVVPLEDWKTKIVAVANAVGLKTENWVEGGYTRTLVALFAQLYATLGDVVRIVTAGGFLDTAEGEWLTFLAKNVFNVTRIRATYASAANGITLTNSGGGVYTLEAGDLVVAHVDTGATYRNTSGGTLHAGETKSFDLAAEEPGNDSNADPGKITVMVTTFLGVTCTNTVALAGLDEESDEALRQRCRDSMAALAIGGPASAYEYIAKSAVRADGTPIGITRVFPMPATGDGTVDVYLATVSGAVPAEDVAVVQADFDALVTPYGFYATAISATNLNVSVPCTVWVPATIGVSEEAAQLAVKAALEIYVTSVPIGGVVIPPDTGKVYWRALLGVVEGAIPGMLTAQLASEVDIPVGVGQVPVWAGSLSETTVIQVVT